MLVERAPGRVRVTVRDNGRGIAPRSAGAHLRAVRAGRPRARRAAAAASASASRSSSNLVERHGGTIAAHSDGPRPGRRASRSSSRRSRRAPTPAEPSPPPQAADRARAACACWSSTTTSTSRSSCPRRCRSRASRPPSRTTAQAALERWRSFVPHAAVLDVGSAGRSTATSSPGRCAPSTARRPTLIAATGYGQPQDRLRAADAGFDCHFVKPVSVHDLVLVLDERVVAPEPGA